MSDPRDVEIVRLRAALFNATSILRIISTTIKTGRVREPTPMILQAWARAMDEASDPLEVSLDGEVPWPKDLLKAIRDFNEYEGIDPHTLEEARETMWRYRLL